MNIKAVLIYSYRAGFQNQLEHQLMMQHIPIIDFVDPDFSWRRRMMMNMEIAAQNPDDLLVFLDAWDTLLLGTRQEIADLRLDKGVTFAAQKLCWPDFSLEGAYSKKSPRERSPWKYINSNPMAGLGKNVFKALDWGWKRFPLKTDTNLMSEPDVCEKFLAQLYLKAPKKFDLKLDTECRLSQVFRKSLPGDLYLDDDRIINMVHRTKPIFLHANGRTVVPEELIDARFA